MNLYLGNVDGYFAVSNMPFDNTRQNSLAPLFSGKDGAVMLELPSLRSLSPAAPAFGFRLTGQTGQGSTTAELALTGTTQPILRCHTFSIAMIENIELNRVLPQVFRGSEKEAPVKDSELWLQRKCGFQPRTQLYHRGRERHGQIVALRLHLRKPPRL